MQEMALKYRDHFEKSYAEYGENVEALDLHVDSQYQRFEVLCQIGDLAGKNILDVGCGFGDLYKFLCKKNIPISEYLGVDISEQFIKIARKRYPLIPFYCGNVLDFQPPIGIDYSLASGIFQLDDLRWEEYFLAACRKMLNVSRLGIGLNLLSANEASRGNPDDRFSMPWEILKLVMAKLSTKVTLRHDYRDNDFTIYVYK